MAAALAAAATLAAASPASAGPAAGVQEPPVEPLRLAIELGDAGREAPFSPRHLRDRLLAAIREIPTLAHDEDSALTVRLLPACLQAQMRREAERGGVLTRASACRLTADLSIAAAEGPFGAQARLVLWSGNALQIAPTDEALDELMTATTEWLDAIAAAWSGLDEERRDCWAAVAHEGAYGDWWASGGWPGRVRETAEIMDLEGIEEADSVRVEKDALVDLTEWLSRELFAAGPCSGD